MHLSIYNNALSHRLNRTIGATVDLTWYVIVPMMNILGINRILVLLHERTAKVIFGGTGIVVREELLLDANKSNNVTLLSLSLFSCGRMALHGGCIS